MDRIQVHDLYGIMSEASAMRLLAMNETPMPRGGTRCTVDAQASSGVTGVSGMPDDAPDDRFVYSLRFIVGAGGCLYCLFAGAEDRYPTGPPDALGLPSPAEGIGELKRLSRTGRPPACPVDSAELLPPTSPGGAASLVVKLSRSRITDEALGPAIPEKLTFFVRFVGEERKQ